MTYKLILDIFTKQPMAGQVLRVEDGACIPFDPTNTDYQVYLKWLDGYEEQFNPQTYRMGWVKTSDGNTPLPADE